MGLLMLSRGKPRRTAAAVLLAALPCGAIAQDARNSVNFAFAATPPIGGASATALMVEYERLVTPQLSVFGRGTSLKYKSDDNTYVEEGTSTGFGGGARYFFGEGFKGWYAGGTLGLFKSTWEWIDDKGKSFETRGKGDSSSLQWGFEAGYRYRVAGNFAVTPAFNVGSWLGGDDSCTYTAPASQAGQTCSKKRTVGTYFVPSVALSILF